MSKRDRSACYIENRHDVGNTDAMLSHRQPFNALSSSDEYEHEEVPVHSLDALVSRRGHET
eukprot:7957466-Karenia_brevis.AAC.1